MKADAMRRRAKAALVPTWPQVRTFTAAEVEANDRASLDYEVGPISSWLHDLRTRSDVPLWVEVTNEFGRVAQNVRPVGAVKVEVRPAHD